MFGYVTFNVKHYILSQIFYKKNQLEKWIKVCFKKTGTECSSDTLLWFVLVFWNRCYLLCTQLFEVISSFFIFCDYARLLSNPFRKFINWLWKNFRSIIKRKFSLRRLRFRPCHFDWQLNVLWKGSLQSQWFLICFSQKSELSPNIWRCRREQEIDRFIWYLPRQ